LVLLFSCFCLNTHYIEMKSDILWIFLKLSGVLVLV
jgi:hypothetical protein